MRCRLQPAAGFSLLELLVVIGILSLVTGMIFAGTGKERTGAAVRHQAELLEATCIKARNLAMSRRAMFAVVFNIQNAPGSTGAVLNNRSGGHWYRILGPAPDLAGNYDDATSDYSDRIPYPGRSSFKDLLREVSESWLGDPVVLPPRRVRFLALGDTDEGPAIRCATANDAKTVRYADDPTYPRPWFGYFDAGTGTLWPWGGYEPGKRHSGFYYQGQVDGPITGCSNNAPSLHYLPAGEARPLVNAAWLDAGIAFFPDGRARFFEWNRGRRCYRYQPTLTEADSSVQHLAKLRVGYTLGNNYATANAIFTSIGGGTTGYEDFNGAWDHGYDGPEVTHFDRHTGGWYITLAPDVLEDNTAFASAHEALNTLTPACRVYVGRNGSTAVVPVRVQATYPAERKFWPTAPADWLSTVSAGTNPVWANCRLGWLHRADTSNYTTPLVPRGSPIVDIVSPMMLTKRIWWLDE